MQLMRKHHAECVGFAQWGRRYANERSRRPPHPGPLPRGGEGEKKGASRQFGEVEESLRTESCRRTRTIEKGNRLPVALRKGSLYL